MILFPSRTARSSYARLALLFRLLGSRRLPLPLGVLFPLPSPILPRGWAAARTAGLAFRAMGLPTRCGEG
eukprot:scaffold7621_cov286-Pinguiococcus_pyrenoidosus.AAC.1